MHNEERIKKEAPAGASQTVKKPARLQVSEGRIPSIGEGKHACQRVFPALFVPFTLAGASPPASQKPKITRKSIAGRCGAVLSEQKCVQTRKDPQRILAVLSRGLTQYGRISARQNRVCPCRSMVVKGNRQGSLSRSITRRSDQNRKIKYCFLFCDFASQLVKKVRSDFFDKLRGSSGSLFLYTLCMPRLPLPTTKARPAGARSCLFRYRSFMPEYLLLQRENAG